jgi:hypothetical protein
MTREIKCKYERSEVSLGPLFTRNKDHKGVGLEALLRNRLAITNLIPAQTIDLFLSDHTHRLTPFSRTQLGTALLPGGR